jgi:hypothetical protein
MNRFWGSLIISLGIAISVHAAEPAGESPEAARIKSIRAPFEENILKPYPGLAAEVKKAIAVDFEVSAQLLSPGEEMTLTVRARSEGQPNSALEVWENCYDVTPSVSSVNLEWKKIAESGGFEVVWKWIPPHCGNYLLHWRCDVGGDVPDFWRNVSVVDRGWAVMILNSTAHIQPRPEPDFHEFHLPFSYWAEISPFNPMSFAENYLAFSRGNRQYGDDAALFLYLGGDYLKDDKSVFYDEPEQVQRSVLEMYREFWPLLGFPKPLTSVYSYGVGNVPTSVARSLGYNVIGALCADQNWKDGLFKINHWGMPARPYFVSPQDFRKPGPGGKDAMVGVQQCERQTVLCRDYGCVYSFESAIEYAFERYAGIDRSRVIDDMVLSREMDFLECFLDAAEMSDHPYLFCSGVEFNGVWPDMAAVNRQYMKMLAERARSSKLAFTTALAAADYMRGHLDRTPESVAYFPDVFSGMGNGGKPALYPDTMEVENSEFRSIFRRGETLPYAQYDYLSDWSYQDWGNDSVPRKEDGYLVPNTEDRFRVTPSIIDSRKFEVTSAMEERAEGTFVSIDVEARAAQRNLSLAVWDIPRAFTTDSSNVVLNGGKRFIPVRASFTGNFCGIVVADVLEGKSRIELLITSAKRDLKTIDYQINDLVKGKLFERNGRSTLYLFLDGVGASDVVVTIPQGIDAKLYPFDSDDSKTLVGEAKITVEQGKFQRVTGLKTENVLQAFPCAKSIPVWTSASPLK